ncbi:MAG: tRNA (guanosine(37)-N1)-methyltransferase TrmD [Calditrichaeota bacterium]|nr:tRNA (guanosine(37)-N1)-methyltransferase TrmD [Calditrichota bacterium]
MKIHIITAFPDLIRSPLSESIIKRAQEKGLVEIFVHNLRDYSENKHHKVDDYPYGGAPGMVLKPEPIFNCIEAVLRDFEIEKPNLIFLTPQGKKYNQKKAVELSLKEHLIFLCGHYKGVDERVREYWQMDEISVGDYVLSGGELPALVVVDSVVRLIPGVISDINSATTDSFFKNRLDCPYYTRPEVYRGMKVPEVLRSGHHAEIKKWQEQKSWERTLQHRRDLLDSKNDQEFTDVNDEK